MFMRHRTLSLRWLAPLALVLVAWAGPALADPPGRVARLSYLGGEVSFQPAGVNEWTHASLNRPLIAGDGLYVDRGARAEMDVGSATIRLDERTAFNLLNLDDEIVQIELTEGVLNLSVRRVFAGQVYEINTPTLAFVVDRAGKYRVDIAPAGDSTMITVFDGSGSVYGSNNASYSVSRGLSYRFRDSDLRDYEVFDLPREDAFDRWCYERDDRYERSVSRRYVSEDMIGYADLDNHGSWSTAPTYGSIWYPSRVDVGWAPYRHGRWAWIDPWGWTWVDNSPWGFAPFHYGRWAYVGSRWGWVPGPRNVRPIYAPALVAFVGGNNFGVSISVGGGGPVGWFPLGPRDVYVPWYRGSRNYFNNINVRNTTIINNTYITNVYNDYSRGRPVSNFNYAYRNNESAFTAVPRDAFVNSRAVNVARMQVNQTQLARGDVLSRLDVAPVAASIVAPGAGRGGRIVAPPAAIAQRGVIARTAPPPRAAPMDARIQAIQRNANQPLAVTEMRQLSTQRAAQPNQRAAQRVQVVGGGIADGATPRALPERSANERVAAPGRAAPSSEPGASRGPPAQRAPAIDNAQRPAPGRASPARTDDRALPSTRYAPGRDNGRVDAPRATERAPQADAPIRRAPDIGRQQPERAQPQQETPRSVPQRAPQRVNPADTREREVPVRAPQRVAPETQRETPVRAPQRVAPETQRQTPVRAPQRVAPETQRETPVRAPQRVAPETQRSAPPPQQRAAPLPQQQRTAPPQEQRVAPPPQQQQQRTAPPPQQRAAPPTRKEIDAKEEAKQDAEATERRRRDR